MPCLSLRWIFALLWLLAGSAWATAYSLPAATFLPPCSGSWDKTQNICGGRVVLQDGDSVAAGSSLVISAAAGFELKGNNLLGSVSSSVSLKSDYGSVLINAGSTLHGSIATGSGEVSLTSTYVSGGVTGSGTATFISSQIDGDVQRNNGITGSDTVFGGSISISNGSLTLVGGKVIGNITVSGSISLSGVEVLGTVTSTNGDISISGGSVKGKVSTPCCTVTSSGANLYDGITARSGISISGGVIAGDFYMTSNNSISITDATMTSGSINAWNVTVSNSQLGSVGAAVSVDANGNYLKVLSNSTVYGSLTVDNTYGKLTIDSTSRVYGTCKAESKPNTNNNVIGICSPLPASSVNHYRLSYSSQALTCQAQTVTVTACTDAACSSSYTAGSSSLTVTPGSAAISFTGSTTTSIAVRSAGTVTLAVSNANPPPVGDTLCRIDGAAASTNCNLTFADSGLLVQAPDLLAGQSDTLSVTAVRKSDNSAACVPAFANVTRPVAFWSVYVDPDAATQVGNRAVSVAATSVANSSAGSTSVDLAFDAQGTARVALNYFDAGQVQLNALYQGNATRGDAGLTMSGSGSFVSRPAALGITAARPDGSSLAAAACLDASGAPTPDAAGCRTWKAGDDFTLTITPLAADGSTVTRNFRLSGIKLGSTLLAPSGGTAGSLAPASYDHPLGGAYGLSVRHSEVGVFQLGAAAQASYFGYDVSGQSAAVGRFTPAYLGASASAQLTLSLIHI